MASPRHQQQFDDDLYRGRHGTVCSSPGNDDWR
jgi:hypothetical protein